MYASWTTPNQCDDHGQQSFSVPSFEPQVLYSRSLETPDQSNWMYNGHDQCEPCFSMPTCNLASHLEPAVSEQTQFASFSAPSSYSRPPMVTRSGPSSPERLARAKVPTIITQFAGQPNETTEQTVHSMSVTPEFQHSSSSDMLDMDVFGSIMLHESRSADKQFAVPSLQDPFQLHPSMTRRTSISSNASGAFFSYNSTPSTSCNYDLPFDSPYPRSASWTPQSAGSNPMSSISPISPNSFSRSRYGQAHITTARLHHLDAKMQKYHRNAHGGVAKTLPSRAKPDFDHSLSEGSIPTVNSTSCRPSRSAGARRKTLSMLYDRVAPRPMHGMTQQFALPTHAIDTFNSSPTNDSQQWLTCNLEVPQAQQTQSTHQNVSSHGSEHHQLDQSGINTQMFHVKQEGDLFDAPPPPSDWNILNREPKRQEPQFPGDLYTPRYKRRDPVDQYWEGWCPHCPHGGWYNLKNSRYWDHLKKSHGISAHTKQRFSDPVGYRCVDLEGHVVELNTDQSCIQGWKSQYQKDDWLVNDLDGSIRRQQGLCGRCGDWINMHTTRGKALERPVGWWLHAGDCQRQRARQ